MKVVALINAGAGTVERHEPEAFVERLAAGFAAHGVEVEIELLNGDEIGLAAERARARAAAAEIDAIAVGGGDGTIRTVAGVLAGSDVPLGLLPLGTLNHFARDLGVPSDLDAAVAVIAGGATQAVDVGEVNGEVFVNNSSIGVYPYMVLDRERRRSLHGLTKWTAMALAAVRTLRYLPLRRLSIRAGGRAEPFRTPCAFIGNNEYGLTMPALGKREKLDDGELCLYVARADGRLALLWLALRAALGFVREARDLRTLRAPEADISARLSRLPVALDGEVHVLRPPLRYRVRPRALRVFVPGETT
jgi:diacylglycerol kinase family enzyme